jgi:acid phosphatase class B
VVLFYVFLIVLPFILPGCGTSTDQPASDVQVVGFDLDDTLVFSTPAFEQGFDRAEEPFSEEFWSIVNSSDTQHSCTKPEVAEKVRKHRKKGHKIYVITARESVNGEALRRFVESEFGIPRDHVYFEPDDKTERLKTLGIDIYYGDSDSDITDSQEADVKPIRIQRNPESNYDKKYTPGTFDEKVLENTAGHEC